MKSSNFKLNQQTSKSHKKLYLSVTVILILAVVIATLLYLKQRNNSPNTPQTDDSAQTNSAKKDTIKQDKSDSGTSNLPTNSTSTTTEQVPKSTEIKVTSLNFNQAGDTLTTSADVSGTTTTGTCVFSFKSVDEKPVLKQVESTAQQCSATFSKFEFSKLGTWNLSVVRYQGDSKVEATREITIT